MIVYHANKTEFLFDNDHRDIEDVILARFREATGQGAGDAERRSWKESLNAMAKVLRDDGIPDDLEVAVEFVLPQSCKRIDVTLSGCGNDGSKRVVIIELKQWSEAAATTQDAIVLVRYGKSLQRAVHPSYQAWSYAAFLQGFNEAVYDGAVQLHPCAYLHNWNGAGAINADQYAPYLQKAPLYLAGEKGRLGLRAFIKTYVPRGPGRAVLFELESGCIRPSKALADSVVKLLKGNPEFTLLDDQKEVFEAAKAACRQAMAEAPRVVIVKGGPGTGKSVVAVNLLSTLRDGLVVKYVSKNAAPRAVYSEKLMQEPSNAHLANLFAGSGSFVETPKGSFDALIVDEAHRLTEKSGFYGNLGDHQVRELMNAAKCTVFFIDERQRITLKDVGTTALIRALAAERGAHVEEYELASQFRCAGSDGYVAWLDQALQIRPTANGTLKGVPYDFQVFDDPAVMHAAIEAKNANNKARVVAGYCWPWKSRKDPTAYDVVIGDYARQWNLDQDGSLWIVAPESAQQVGCIHTCQGLEVDYVGVIIGPDLVMHQDAVVTVPRARDRHDKTMKGFVKMSKADPARAAQEADEIIRNTYRTLMTRGMKGCYVYATDPAMRAYLRGRMSTAAG